MTHGRRNSGGLVYSTAQGRMCPGCSQPIAKCICRHVQVKPSSDGYARIRLETKGRKGKGVTVISGLPLDSEELLALGKELKQRCGSGGTIKDGQIEVQGDHRDVIAAELTKRGWKFKFWGG